MRSVLLTFICLSCSSLLDAQSPYVGQGKVYFADSIVSGEILFRPTHAGEIGLRKDTSEKKYRRYTTTQIKSFELDSLQLKFEPRKYKGGDVSIRPLPVFMEVLITTKTGLNMYIEHYQEGRNKEVLTFCVGVPGDTEAAYDLNAFKFFPKFDEKVSKIVDACPVLAEKIKKKEKGYFYNLMSQHKAPDIWSDIILEYKKCIGD